MKMNSSVFFTARKGAIVSSHQFKFYHQMSGHQGIVRIEIGLRSQEELLEIKSSAELHQPLNH